MKKIEPRPLRKPTLPKGLVHWLPKMPKVNTVGRYACKTKIKRFNFTNRLDLITCPGCMYAAGTALAAGNPL